MEAMVGTLIAIVAVLGLAYSFGIGRGMIDRYRVARVALALAQRRMEVLSALPPGSDSLTIRNPTGTTYGPNPFNVDGREVGAEEWTAEWYDDPLDRLAPSDLAPHDLKLVTVRVIWRYESRPDTVLLSRLFQDP
jgi:hypothetical protein